jgi:hypothetical protein
LSDTLLEKNGMDLYIFTHVKKAFFLSFLDKKP